MAQGKTNAEIGIILGMSPGTVKTHLQYLSEKLGVETRQEPKPVYFAQQQIGSIQATY